MREREKVGERALTSEFLVHIFELLQMYEFNSFVEEITQTSTTEAGIECKCI
jgi:hypothetical protein